MIDVIISYNIFAKIHVIIETNARDRDYDVVKNRKNINKLINKFKFVNYICDRNTIYKKCFIKTEIFAINLNSTSRIYFSVNQIVDSSQRCKQNSILLSEIVFKHRKHQENKHCSL